MRILIISILLLSITGCLKTRAELQGDNSSSLRTDTEGRYVSGQMNQQQRAQIDSRFFEIDRDFRQLYGKIEAMEKQISDIQPASPMAPTDGSSSDKVSALEKRISTLEEALLAIDKKVSQLGGADKKTSAVLKPARAKGPFGLGEILFSQGKYAEAITSYDKYRKQFPRGKHYAEATLKLGLSFQKLKMNQDAKAFYKEVIQRYPNTMVSQQAQKNLKSI